MGPMCYSAYSHQPYSSTHHHCTSRPNNRCWHLYGRCPLLLVGHTQPGVSSRAAHHTANLPDSAERGVKLLPYLPTVLQCTTLGLQDLYMVEVKSPTLHQIHDSLPQVSGITFLCGQPNICCGWSCSILLKHSLLHPVQPQRPVNQDHLGSMRLSISLMAPCGRQQASLSPFCIFQSLGPFIWTGSGNCRA